MIDDLLDVLNDDESTFVVTDVDVDVIDLFDILCDVDVNDVGAAMTDTMLDELDDDNRSLDWFESTGEASKTCRSRIWIAAVNSQAYCSNLSIYQAKIE